MMSGNRLIDDIRHRHWRRWEN